MSVKASVKNVHKVQLHPKIEKVQLMIFKYRSTEMREIAKTGISNEFVDCILHKELHENEKRISMIHFQ